MWLLIASLFTFYSHAQVQLDVTAPRMMEASSVKVIDQQKLTSLGQKNILDVLKNEAGLDVAREGLGGQSSVFIRGGESSHVLVLVDGLEVNDPTSPTRSFNFNLLEISEIESIEILKGARSVQYGSDAISGVINIVTKKNIAIGRHLLRARQELGTFSTSKTNMSYRTRVNEHFQYGLKGQYFQTSGYSVAKSPGKGDRDRLTRGRVNVDTNMNIGTHELSLLGEVQKITQNLDGGPNQDDPNANLTSFNGRLAALYQSSWLNDHLTPKIDFSYSHYRRNYSDPFDSANPFPGGDSTTRGGLKKIDYSFEFRPYSAFKISTGGEYQTENMSIESPASSQVMKPTLNHSHGEFVYGQYNFADADLHFGARTDKGNYYSHQENYRAAINYNVTPSLKFLTSYGTGFKAPTLYQVYAPIYGNPEVKSESSRSYDFGTKYQLNNFLKFESSIFFSDYKNLILFNSAKTTRNYENTKKAHIQGLENSMGFNLHPFIQVDLAYTYMEARDVTSDTPLPARSRHKGAIDWRAQWIDDFKTNLSLSMVGKRRNSSSTSQVNAGYTLVAWNADYQMMTKLSVGARIENLLNKEYVELAGYNTQKRSYYLSMTYSFE
ncbi:MAG: TonB-dependent receptor domain-containing protein [Bacteriovoracaceae bacterium]